MEKFDKTFPSKSFSWPPDKEWAIAGVVGSGNLEVLFERNTESPNTMECHVESSIPGYEDSWLAALEDFAANYPAGGTKVTIHDQGAAPIVVTFRLRQAYDHLLQKIS
jgi:malonate decarboxylase delta subunit